MPRGLTSTQNALIKSRDFGAALFVELLDTSPLRAWTGIGSLTISGNTWVGVGEFGVVDGIESSKELRGTAISVGLQGLPASAFTPGIIASTRSKTYQYDDLNVYLGLFRPNDFSAPVDGLIPFWAGLADVLSFKLGNEVSALLSGEHLTSLLRRPNGLRASTQSHKQRLGGTTDYFYEPQNRLMGRASAFV